MFINFGRKTVNINHIESIRKDIEKYVDNTEYIIRIFTTSKGRFEFVFDDKREMNLHYARLIRKLQAMPFELKEYDIYAKMKNDKQKRLEWFDDLNPLPHL